MLPWGAWGLGGQEGASGGGGQLSRVGPVLGRGEEVQGSQAVGQAGRTQPDLCSLALSSPMSLSHLKNNRHQRLPGEQAAGPFTSLSLGHLPVNGPAEAPGEAASGPAGGCGKQHRCR